MLTTIIIKTAPSLTSTDPTITMPDEIRLAGDVRGVLACHADSGDVVYDDLDALIEAYRLDSDAVWAAVVEAAAEQSAAVFVEEWHEPLDPAETDWDGEAWALDASDLGVPDERQDALWEVYEAALVRETRRLCRAA